MINAVSSFVQKDEARMRVAIDIFMGPRGFAAEPTNTSDQAVTLSRERLKVLEERYYRTYKSRLKTHERLVRRGQAWSVALVSLATATTITSVALLSDSSIFGDKGATLLAALSIISLVLSLVVSNANYGARGAQMQSCYKRIQQISLRAEQMQLEAASIANEERLRADYMSAVESSENHSHADYLRSFDDWQPSRTTRVDSLATFSPFLFLAIPAILLFVVMSWYFGG